MQTLVITLSQEVRMSWSDVDRHKHTHTNTNTTGSTVKVTERAHKWKLSCFMSGATEGGITAIKAKPAKPPSRGNFKKKITFIISGSKCTMVVFSNPSALRCLRLRGNKSSAIYGAPSTKHRSGTCWGAVMLTVTLAAMLARAANRRRERGEGREWEHMESGWCELRLCQGAVSLQEEALNKKMELNERLRHQERLFFSHKSGHKCNNINIWWV